LVLLPFFSMVDRRKSLHHDVISSSRRQFPEMLTTEIPYSSDIERMSLRREPLAAYAPRSAVGQVYSLLWREIETRMRHSAGAAAAGAGSAAAAPAAVAAPVIAPAVALGHNEH